MTLQVWQSLLKPRGFEIASGKLVRSPSKSQHPKLPGPPRQASPPHADAGGSLISSFRRANSFAPLPDGTSAPRQPFRRTSTLGALPLPRGDTADAGADAGPASSTTAVSCCPLLFAGLKFLVLGEAKCPNVRTAIEGSGGVMVSEGVADDTVDYVLVRLVRYVYSVSVQRERLYIH